jgi:CheY-like chemotaxis protein
MPDLVVLDLSLPDIPGEQVRVSLRRYSSVPVLMLTAQVGRGRPAAGAGAGGGRLPWSSRSRSASPHGVWRSTMEIVAQKPA